MIYLYQHNGGITLKTIAVYCGSRIPNNPIYKEVAIELANYFVDNNIRLVYGGATVGIMGIIADEMIRLNGTVIGVMPKVLTELEILHPNLTELIETEDMHARKKTMMDLADAFIAFPGGCGTMEEIFEVITWSQIGIHTKPYGFLNLDHFYDGIETYLDTATNTGFLSKENRSNIIFESNFDEFMDKLIA